MKRRARLVSAVVVPLLLATSCAIEPSHVDEKEDVYLERVRSALAPLRTRATAYDRVFQKTKSRERFVSDLKKIRAYKSVERVRARIRRLTPPPRFFGDQSRLLRTLAEIQPVASLAGILANDENLVPAAVRHAQLVSTYEVSLTENSGRFCLVAANTDVETDLCDPLGILPGGIYGDRLHAILARLAAVFTPKGFLFVPRVFTNDEVAQYLGRVQPEIVTALDEARSEIRRLVPPDDFVADQRVIESYFDEFLDLSQKISSAAKDNPPDLHALFPQSRQIVNRARTRLSKDIRASVAVWFFPSG